MPTIIHPGFPRTATTWLQAVFREEATHNPRVVYLGKLATSKDWADESLAMLVQSIRLRGEVSSSSAKAVRRLTSDEKLTLLSDETLSKPIAGQPDTLKRRALAFKAAFGSAHIVLTVRNQVARLFSLYSRSLQKRRSLTTRHAPSFEAWICDGLTHASPPFVERFSFLPMYSCFADVFAPENISVLFYEEFMANPAYYTDELKCISGVEFASALPQEKINQSVRQPLAGQMLQHPLRALRDQFVSRRVAMERECSKLAYDKIRASFARSNGQFPEAIRLQMRQLDYPLL